MRLLVSLSGGFAGVLLYSEQGNGIFDGSYRSSPAGVTVGSSSTGLD